jgi:hypothetical protein
MRLSFLAPGSKKSDNGGGLISPIGEGAAVRWLEVKMEEDRKSLEARTLRIGDSVP